MKRKSPREQKLDDLILSLPYFSTESTEEGGYFRRTIGYLNRTWS